MTIYQVKMTYRVKMTHLEQSIFLILINQYLSTL